MILQKLNGARGERSKAFQLLRNFYLHLNRIVYKLEYSGKTIGTLYSETEKSKYPTQSILLIYTFYSERNLNWQFNVLF